MRASSGLAELSLASELAKALGLGTDRAMFDVDVASSIANGGVILTSAGSSLANIDADIKLMLAYFATTDAALDSAVFAMSATTAAYLGSLRGTGGANAFPNIGARGGSLLGIPIFVSGALTYSGSPSNANKFARSVASVARRSGRSRHRHVGKHRDPNERRADSKQRHADRHDSGFHDANECSSDRRTALDQLDAGEHGGMRHADRRCFLIGADHDR